MRFFYVAVAETRRDILAAIIDTIKEWDEKARRRGIRVGVLIRYTKWRARPCLPCRMALEHGLKVFVDNGAFTFLSAEELEAWPRPEKLDYWLKDYAGWLKNHFEEFDYAALADLPVHGKKFLGDYERTQRILLSTILQARLLSMLSERTRRKMVPVVQGFYVGEYQLSYDLLWHAGVIPNSAYMVDGDYADTVAVGSICVRKPSANGKTSILAEGKAAGTLHTIMRLLLEECCRDAKFHFFGLHREAVEKWGRHPRFYASDSGAHGLNYRFKWRTILGCEAPNTPECAAKAVHRQLQRTLQPLLQKPVEAFF